MRKIIVGSFITLDGVMQAAGGPEEGFNYGGCKSNVLMGSDVLQMMGQVTENDNRNTISISAESREEADKLFNGLSEGGKIEMPIAEGPLGSYFGMFADKYGIQWMVDFAQNTTGKSN